VEENVRIDTYITFLLKTYKKHKIKEIIIVDK